ncbi:gamma-glutamyltransferase [Parvibaculum sp.]|uniref:gamma-glutamyltransferase n=1 Tax=Parvibaculum sp. TaxID=2024848 RepID=UPI002B69C35E|nr:gamma-glutamyltransferase [Parvibaculum sp.]HUD52350.1 gamma-glutamyltransferase [Parvibaculum sp.]
MRDFHLPGRSTVHSLNGMCATSQPLAAEAAISILKSGGNAVDAAVAASAVLCVVEPYSTGIGGDCFVLLSKKGGSEIVGLNGSGRAPKAAHVDWFLERGIAEIGLSSVHSVTIPGAIDAWEKLLADHGTMELGRVLEPAIRFAEDGFPLSPRIATDWGLLARRLEKDEGARRHYLIDGRAPRLGEIFKSPALAKTLRLIAAQGRKGFYEGPVAEDMVATLKAKGGLHTLEDFAATKANYVEPVRTLYRGREIVEIPPNGQGITALVMLNILERFGLSGLDPNGAERHHIEAEASRLAFEVRDRHVADPDFRSVPVEHMLSGRLADELAARIDPDRALGDVKAAAGPVYRDTVYLTVVDRDRNAVSFINSLYFGFGSAIVAPESGVTFQNRGSGFMIDAAHPNCIEGGKRPLHTIIPGMMLEGGRATMPFGVMGGAYQPVGHAHFVSNLVDYGMDVQEAIDNPRSFHVSGRMEVERGVPRTTREGLTALGHEVAEAFLPWGGGQAILIDWKEGGLVGGSDARKDGAAIGY